MTTPEIPGATLPPGLPDPATLARLAGEVFAALPGTGGPAIGGVPVPATVQPAGLSLPPGASGPATPAALPTGVPPGANLVPTSPQPVAVLGATAPKLVPNASAPNGVPDHVLEAAPGYDGRVGSQVLGVPEAHATQVPSGVSAGGAPLASPPGGYYFLDAAQGIPQQTGELKVPGIDALLPSSFGLPGAPLPGFDAAPRVPTASLPGVSEYYFIEHAPRRDGAVPAVPAGAHPPFDVNAVRRDFPILQERVNGRPLVWFDNAATTQKPQVVIDRLAYF